MTPLAGALDFELPAGLEASRPPEARGLTRDGVRLLVSAGGRHLDTTFDQLPTHLAAGDLLVVNVSAVVPAAVPADGGRHLLHLSTALPGGLWLAELRVPAGAGTGPVPVEVARSVDLDGGGTARLLAPFGGGRRLWFTSLRLPGPLQAYLARWGRPVRYAYAAGDWPLSAYQNVYAAEPGSAEPPSAGRPFTAELLVGLLARGVAVAPVVLHTGVSSQEEGEAPHPERYRVPPATARAVNDVRRAGGRVVAVGTTTVRALETVADEAGEVHPGSGWTELVVTPERGVRAVGGLLTGWHPPRASHLRLLEAVAGRPALEGAYAEALAASYLWHEFGDSHLILP